jgi:cytidine deaminase
VINEFGPDARIVSICRGQGQIASSLHELLPGAFGPADLA